MLTEQCWKAILKRLLLIRQKFAYPMKNSCFCSADTICYERIRDGTV